MYTHAIGMLHNVAKERWHTILFESKPLPGSAPGPARYKSMMHHTEGCTTREESLKGIEDLVAKVKDVFGGVTLVDTEKDIPWDGEGVPAIVAFVSDDKIIIM